VCLVRTPTYKAMGRGAGGGGVSPKPLLEISLACVWVVLVDLCGGKQDFWRPVTRPNRLSQKSEANLVSDSVCVALLVLLLFHSRPTSGIRMLKPFPSLL